MRKEIAQDDFYIGITGWLCDERRGLHLREMVGSIPANRLMIETDSPYLAPVPYRGKRNESSYTLLVAEKLAQIYELPVAEIARITTENSKAVFGI